MVIEDGENVVRNLGEGSRGDWASIFKLLTGVGPQGQVGIGMSSGLFGRNKAIGLVQKSIVQMGSHLLPDRVGLCIRLETIQGFWEIQRGVEERCVSCDLLGRGVLGLNLKMISLLHFPGWQSRKTYYLRAALRCRGTIRAGHRISFLGWLFE